MRDFNARHMMEQAIEVMRKSIAEPREDGKASPKVGAVLLNLSNEVPSKARIEFAFRGELRHGDHAEYTLLERKNRDRKLDDCVLFSTLEPCALMRASLPSWVAPSALCWRASKRSGWESKIPIRPWIGRE